MYVCSMYVCEYMAEPRGMRVWRRRLDFMIEHDFTEHMYSQHSFTHYQVPGIHSCSSLEAFGSRIESSKTSLSSLFKVEECKKFAGTDFFFF